MKSNQCETSRNFELCRSPPCGIRSWTASFLAVAALSFNFILTPSQSAEPTLTIDLNSPPASLGLTRIFGRGAENDGILGVPVCGGLDCDGDGFADFAFAQFLGDPLGRTGAGEVTFVFGDGSIGFTAQSATIQPRLLRIAGEQPGETAGAEVWIDDVTGDGLGDLLIGRQNYSLTSEERRGSGGLTLLIGSPVWRTQANSLEYWDLGTPPEGAKQITFVGPSPYDRLGIWMRTGDITGDGIADILVGADEVDADGSSVSQNQGAVFVIRGGSHLLDAPEIIDLAETSHSSLPRALKGHIARIDPPDGSDDFHFGGTVQVCDLDGNGPAEVIVAATLNRAGASVRLPNAPSGTGEGSGGSTNGTVFIIWNENFPPDLWPDNYRFKADRPPIGSYTRIDGPEDAQAVGEEILGGLDYSGDGFPDLMIGDLVADPASRTNAGRGYAFYNAGNLRGLDFNLDIPPIGVSFSTIDGPVAGAISSDTMVQGDFDGDGIADVGIGNPHDTFLDRSDAGSVHVLYGQPGGWPTNIDLLPASLPPPQEMRIAWIQGAKGTTGSDRGDTLCYSAASGDINGDGRTDLIINEMAGNALGGTLEDVGNMLVIDATSLLEPFQSSLQRKTPGLLDFGIVQTGTGGQRQSLILQNTGSESLTISGLTLVGPQSNYFSITQDSGETSLGAGAERVLEIVFEPEWKGRYGAALRVSIDSAHHASRFGMSGSGVEDNLIQPKTRIRVTGNTTIIEALSQFGAKYSLRKANDLRSGYEESINKQLGTGNWIYFIETIDPKAFEQSFYQTAAQR